MEQLELFDSTKEAAPATSTLSITFTVNVIGKPEDVATLTNAVKTAAEILAPLVVKPT